MEQNNTFAGLSAPIDQIKERMEQMSREPQPFPMVMPRTNPVFRLGQDQVIDGYGPITMGGMIEQFEQITDGGQRSHGDRGPAAHGDGTDHDLVQLEIPQNYIPLKEEVLATDQFTFHHPVQPSKGDLLVWPINSHQYIADQLQYLLRILLPPDAIKAYLFKEVPSIRLAGGYLANLLLNGQSDPVDTDLDFFFVGVETEEQMWAQVRKTLNWFYTLFKGKMQVYVSDQVITLVSQHEQLKTIQLILRRYDTEEQVLAGFDLNCCMFLFDGYNLLTNRVGVLALTHRVMLVHPKTYYYSFNKRVVKYFDRFQLKLYIWYLDHSKISNNLACVRRDKPGCCSAHTRTIPLIIHGIQIKVIGSVQGRIMVRLLETKSDDWSSSYTSGSVNYSDPITVTMYNWYGLVRQVNTGVPHHPIGLYMMLGTGSQIFDDVQAGMTVPTDLVMGVSPPTEANLKSFNSRRMGFVIRGLYTKEQLDRIEQSNHYNRTPNRANRLFLMVAQQTFRELTRRDLVTVRPRVVNFNEGTGLDKADPARGLTLEQFACGWYCNNSADTPAIVYHQDDNYWVRHYQGCRDQADPEVTAELEQVNLMSPFHLPSRHLPESDGQVDPLDLEEY